MPSREEIREEIEDTLRVCGANPLTVSALAYDLMLELSKKGVVIKVDRKLPFVTSNYTLSAHGVYARINKEALSEQGYETVKPLIKE